MSSLDAFDAHAGRWTGTNLLWLPPSEVPYESPSTAEVTRIVGGNFLQIAYTWAFDGAPQEGLLLLGHEESGLATAVWIDSWHMGRQFLICRGSIEPSGMVVNGSYAVEGYPEWGWQIVVGPADAAGDAFALTMYNIPPEGDKMLAVSVNYTRER